MWWAQAAALADPDPCAFSFTLQSGGCNKPSQHSGWQLLTPPARTHFSRQGVAINACINDNDSHDHFGPDAFSGSEPDFPLSPSLESESSREQFCG